jgi:DNA-directed RNA polymerase specialized sigma24 family protein
MVELLRTNRQFGILHAFNSGMNDVTYAQAYTNGMDRTIRFIISRGANREVAEEMAQMAWARAWERLHQLKDESTILAWVNTIALNLYRRSFRRHLSFVQLEDMPVSGRLNLVEIDLERLISRCRPADQHVLNQQRDGLSIKEIAEMEGITDTAVRLRAMRARRSARAFLRPVLQAA